MVRSVQGVVHYAVLVGETFKDVHTHLRQKKKLVILDKSQNVNNGVQESSYYLGHEVCPSTCGVVDGIQLLQQGAGVESGEVGAENAPEKLAVRGI